MHLANILGKNNKNIDENSGQTHNVGHQIPTHIYMLKFM